MVDVATRKIVKNIPVGKKPRRFLLAGGELWVTSEIDGSVSVIGTADHTVQGHHRFKPQGMRPEDVTPVGMALSPDGRTAYVGLGRANHVAVVDVASRRGEGLRAGGQAGLGLALSRDGKRLYVANGLSDDMSIVDTGSLKAARRSRSAACPTPWWSMTEGPGASPAPALAAPRRRCAPRCPRGAAARVSPGPALAAGR